MQGGLSDPTGTGGALLLLLLGVVALVAGGIVGMVRAMREMHRERKQDSARTRIGGDRDG